MRDMISVCGKDSRIAKSSESRTRSVWLWKIEFHVLGESFSCLGKILSVRDRLLELRHTRTSHHLTASGGILDRVSQLPQLRSSGDLEALV